MPAAPNPPDYEYVAYIDESGEQGLQKIKPLDPDGSSEWLIVAATVIRKVNEDRAKEWVSDVIDKLESPQLRTLHFRRLKPDIRKETACREMGKLPLRCFVVCSNKKNMKGHINPWAAQVPSDNWFYCWLTRVLLERVTLFVAADSEKRFGSVQRVKLVYSKAGGLRYGQMNAYYEWLRDKNRNENQYLKMGDLKYDTIHPLLLEVRSHDADIRLGLADCLASAFFRACDKRDTGGCCTVFAEHFSERMARMPDERSGQISGFGLKLLPGFRKAALDHDQQQIFRRFGYPKQWWEKRRAPDPFVP